MRIIHSQTIHLYKKRINIIEENNFLVAEYSIILITTANYDVHKPVRAEKN